MCLTVNKEWVSLFSNVIYQMPTRIQSLQQCVSRWASLFCSGGPVTGHMAAGASSSCAEATVRGSSPDATWQVFVSSIHTAEDLKDRWDRGRTDNDFFSQYVPARWAFHTPPLQIVFWTALWVQGWAVVLSSFPFEAQVHTKYEQKSFPLNNLLSVVFTATSLCSLAT